MYRRFRGVSGSKNEMNRMFFELWFFARLRWPINRFVSIGDLLRNFKKKFIQRFAT